MRITADSMIGDVLRQEPAAAAFFKEAGMHCIECPSARGETVEQACAVHGIDTDAFLKRFNGRFAK